MKDSKVYSERITKLLRSLKRGHAKITAREHDDPIDAIVEGFVAEAVPIKKLPAAMRRFAEVFVDWNDLRVARHDEIVEVMDVDDAVGLPVAKQLTTALNAIYDAHHQMSLAELKKQGKRQAKQTLEELEGLSFFAQCYCMLTALQGHAIPLNDAMVAFLKAEELVHPQAEIHDIEGFLLRQIGAKEDFETYVLLREASEGSSGSKKKTRRKTKKKVTKKKVTKKVTKKKVTKTTTKKKVTKTKVTKKAAKKAAKKTTQKKSARK